MKIVSEIRAIGLFFNLIGAIFLATAFIFKVEDEHLFFKPRKWWSKIGWYGGLFLLVIGFIFQLIGEYFG